MRKMERKGWLVWTGGLGTLGTSERSCRACRVMHNLDGACQCTLGSDQQHNQATAPCAESRLQGSPRHPSSDSH